MFEHYWQIDILPDGKYSAIELVPYIEIVKESEVDLRFVTKIIPAIGSEEIVLDNEAEVRALIKSIRNPYCFTKKAHVRFTA